MSELNMSGLKLDIYHHIFCVIKKLKFRCYPLKQLFPFENIRSGLRYLNVRSEVRRLKIKFVCPC